MTFKLILFKMLHLLLYRSSAFGNFWGLDLSKMKKHLGGNLKSCRLIWNVDLNMKLTILFTFVPHIDGKISIRPSYLYFYWSGHISEYVSIRLDVIVPWGPQNHGVNRPWVGWRRTSSLFRQMFIFEAPCSIARPLLGSYFDYLNHFHGLLRDTIVSHLLN